MARHAATLEQLPLTVGLPALDTPLRLTIGTGEGLPWPAKASNVPSRLEDVVPAAAPGCGPRRPDRLREAGLAVTEPIHPLTLSPPPPATACLLTWTTEHGLHELPARYDRAVRDDDGPPPRTAGGRRRRWWLTATGQVRRLQRRSHPRVAARLPVAVDGRVGHTVDVGEGGLHCVIDLAGGEPPGPGDLVQVAIALDTTVLAAAQVVHLEHRLADGGRHRLRVRFVEPQPWVAEADLGDASPERWSR